MLTVSRCLPSDLNILRCIIYWITNNWSILLKSETTVVLLTDSKTVKPCSQHIELNWTDSSWTGVCVNSLIGLWLTRVWNLGLVHFI